jgi:membrane protein DedA with SNARE-associated domain
METFLALTARHGYSIIFIAVFAESVGLPVPAALAMIAGGALAASGMLSAGGLFAVCMIAMLAGDSLVYYFGRTMGWWLLALLCKVSINPETCILRSAESFYKRGRTTLVIAKFIPGVATMAAPLAGSMKMRPVQFLVYDLAGAALYALVYAGTGYLFHNFLSAIMRGFAAAGHLTAIATGLAALVYIGYRIRVYLKHRIYREVPRVNIAEVMHKMQSGDDGQILLVDVRSHGYYDAGAQRIRGSIRLEPNNLAEKLHELPKDREIYLYCT